MRSLFSHKTQIHNGTGKGEGVKAFSLELFAVK